MNIKQRNIVTSILLTIVTCGIYGIYWIVMLVKDAVSVKDANDSAVLEIVLSLFLGPVGIFLTEKKFAEGCAEVAVVDKNPKLEGRNMAMFLSPKAQPNAKKEQVKEK